VVFYIDVEDPKPVGPKIGQSRWVV
jgi:hypothetical protein